MTVVRFGRTTCRSLVVSSALSVLTAGAAVRTLNTRMDTECKIALPMTICIHTGRIKKCAFYMRRPTHEHTMQCGIFNVLDKANHMHIIVCVIVVCML